VSSFNREITVGIAVPESMRERRICAARDRRIRFPAIDLSRRRFKRFGNKLATALALSTQRDYNVNRCSVNRKHLQFRVFQRQPSVLAKSGSPGKMFREAMEESERIREDARNLMLLAWAEELLLQEPPN
jgi:hypothetical protein